MTYRNIRLAPFLRLIYFVLRALSWSGVSVFYRRRTIIGAEHLHFDGPAIVISNHPSTLTDVLNTCLPIRQELFFLANYSLFKHPVSNWLLTRLFCIPIKRKEDVAEGEARDNDAAFEQSFRHLQKNGLLFIAPEGVSWMNRWVRPFKTGTARIAFGAERRSNWQLGVKILPIGVTYDAPHLFRSEVVVQYGAPIEVAAWAAADAANHEQAVEDFTLEMEQRVRALTLDARDEAGERLTAQLEEMLRNEAPMPARDSFFRLKKIAEQNIGNEALASKNDAYFEALNAAGLSDEGVCGRATASPRMAAKQWATLTLGLPLAAMGWGFWCLPCYLPWLLARRLNLYVGYDSNVKILAGLLVFPLALRVAWGVAAQLGASGWAGWAAVGVLIAAGYFAEHYLDVLREVAARRRARVFEGKRPSEWAGLLALRAAAVAGR